MEGEFVLDADAYLVSETDQKGVITFANIDFCKAAGYEMRELLGKPHSIVRHKDMPKAAFKDLWETVKKGKVWSGFVKNARKNGGYYWVYATVFPMPDCNGKGGGFMSCRRMASKDEITAAEELYKKMGSAQ